LGRFGSPSCTSLWQFKALLLLTLATSLLAVSINLVLWDSTVSLKLARDAYGWPGVPGGGNWSTGLVAAHLVLRSTEVVGRAVLLAVLLVLLRPSYVAAYLVIGYCINLVVLISASPHKARLQHLDSAAMLGWPLLFANLPQFVDCPKHAAAAHSAAGIMCGLRTLELTLALSAGIAVGVVEAWHEADDGRHGKQAFTLALDPHELRVLYHRSGIIVWVICLFTHYACTAMRWWRSPERSGETFSSRASSRESPSTGASPAEIGFRKDFWPSSQGLAPLLLSAACDWNPPLSLQWPRSCLPSPSFRAAAQLPTRIEDYEVIELIGSGEFGKVFKVNHRLTREAFAMKRLSKEFYARRRMTEKAIREMSTLRLAREHPFVVKLEHIIETPTEWAIVMEYCPAGDLQQLLLNEGSPGLSLKRTSRIASEVVLGLEHLHTRGIVFRDLKLENVVLDAEGHSKLTDFGLAKQQAGGGDAVQEAQEAGGLYASFTKTFCGSYGYAAPEINPHRQVHGFAADMYSFGVLLFMLLTGGEVYHDVREAPWERRLPPETPSSLRDKLGHLGFELYWASHHFLRPSRASHRVEVNLTGEIVLASRGPRGNRRLHRPHRPPNSPLDEDDEPLDIPLPCVPMRFPALACMSSEASQRQWELSLDLVRVLTDEFPERRGTVSTVKQHAFFTEQISDWNAVYPKRWLIDMMKGKLLDLCDGEILPDYAVQRLVQMTSQELASCLEDPDGQVDLLKIPPNMSLLQQDLAALIPEQRLNVMSPVRSSGASSRSASGTGVVSPGSSSHSWCTHYS